MKLSEPISAVLAARICPRCLGSHLYLSRRRSDLEKALGAFWIRPLRCRDCNHRFWRVVRSRKQASARASTPSFNPVIAVFGAAMVGLRPIIEFMTFSFSLVAFDQVVNNAPNMLTMSGGQFNIPITFRGPNGPAHQLGATHSHATECLYANVPGLKICTPATPRDAKGLLKTAIRDDNPVLVLEAELLYSSKGMVEPEDFELLIPLGKAELKREGSDVTIISYAQSVPMATAAAEMLENNEEISAEVLDLRSIKPLDLEAILQSVSKTHRVVIVEQDRPFCGVGAEICYRIQKEIFDSLDAPIMRVAQEDVPMPYNERLERAVLPSVEKLITAVKQVCYT